MRTTLLTAVWIVCIAVTGSPVHALSLPLRSAGHNVALNSGATPILARLQLVGPSGFQESPRVAVSSGGNVFLAGTTGSSTWPVQWTGHCAFPAPSRCSHVFLLKMSPDGSRIYYAILLGGSSEDHLTGLAVDPAGNAYITGTTTSPNFPTYHPLQARCGGPHGNQCRDGFVAKFDAEGRIVYSTFLGGSGDDRPNAIAVGPHGEAFVAGYTYSADFPVSRATQPHLRGQDNAFVTRIDSYGRRLLYSTYLGGSKSDGATGIAVDRVGEAYVTGSTNSADFRTSRHSLQSQFSRRSCGFYGCGDAFLVKLGTAGRFLAGTFIASGGEDNATAVTLDGAGNAYVVGQTTGRSILHSTLIGPGDKNLCGANGDMTGCFSAFIVEIGPWLDRRVYSLLLSGNGYDAAGSVAVDPHGAALLGGNTESTDFPTIQPVQSQNSGGGCSVGKGGDLPCGGFLASIRPKGRGLTFSTYMGGSNRDFLESVALDRKDDAFAAGTTWSSDLIPGHPVPATNGPNIYVAEFSRI